MSFAAIALNVTLNWFFVFHFQLGPRGLALSTSISATFNLLLLYGLMQRAAGRLETARTVSALLRCAAAAALLGAVGWAALEFGGQWLIGAPFLTRLAALSAVMAVAAGVYLVGCFILRVEAVHDAAAAIRRRLVRRRAA